MGQTRSFGPFLIFIYFFFKEKPILGSSLQSCNKEEDLCSRILSLEKNKFGLLWFRIHSPAVTYKPLHPPRVVGCSPEGHAAARLLLCG